MSKVQEILFEFHQANSVLLKKMTQDLADTLGLDLKRTTGNSDLGDLDGDKISRIISKKCQMDSSAATTYKETGDLIDGHANKLAEAITELWDDVQEEIDKVKPKQILDQTLYMKQENFMLEFFVYATIYDPESKLQVEEEAKRNL